MKRQPRSRGAAERLRRKKKNFRAAVRELEMERRPRVTATEIYAEMLRVEKIHRRHRRYLEFPKKNFGAPHVSKSFEKRRRARHKLLVEKRLSPAYRYFQENTQYLNNQETDFDFDFKDLIRAEMLEVPISAEFDINARYKSGDYVAWGAQLWRFIGKVYRYQTVDKTSFSHRQEYITGVYPSVHGGWELIGEREGGDD